LPEPIVDLAGVEPNPADRVTLDESVRMALMIVLEQLSPAERTAFVLHNLFQLPFEAVGEIVGRSAAASRQFCQSGRMEDLVAVLDPLAVGLFDSGGLIPHAPTRPIKGAEHVARVAVQSFGGTGAIFIVADVNGEPGVVVEIGGRLAAVISLSVRDGRVVDLHGVGNPEKLRHLTDPSGRGQSRPQ
jgi:RNA polymerase sigma-70 factor (ECF subfamily)